MSKIEREDALRAVGRGLSEQDAATLAIAFMAPSSSVAVMLAYP